MWRGYRAGRLSGLAASLVLGLLAASQVRAEEPAASPPVINGNGGIISHPAQPLPDGTARSVARDETPETGRSAPPLEHRSILLDLGHLEAPSLNDTSLVNEIAPERDGPGSIVHAYRGLQSVAVRRLLGYYRRFFSQEMKNRWNGNDSIFDINRRIDTMANAFGDMQAGGRWWERTWNQSLTPQLGGAPATPRVVTEGQEIEVFRLGEFAVTNEGKVKVGRLSLYLDDDRIYERIEQKTRDALFTPVRARTDANLARVATPDKERADRPQKALASDEDHIDVSVGLLEDDAALDLERVLAGTSRERARPQSGRFQTPRGNLLSGEGWNVSCHPTLQLRLPDTRTTLPSAVSDAALELNVNLYPGENRQLWGILTFKVSGSPRDHNNVTATAELAIVRW